MRTLRQLAWSVVALGAICAQAQMSSNVSVFATGFNNPRGLKWGPDCNLYVAEGGTGGKGYSTVGKCDQVPPPVGPLHWRIERKNFKGNSRRNSHNACKRVALEQCRHR